MSWKFNVDVIVATPEIEMLQDHVPPRTGLARLTIVSSTSATEVLELGCTLADVVPTPSTMVPVHPDTTSESDEIKPGWVYPLAAHRRTTEPRRWHSSGRPWI
ncbi:MAG: hypothetical protein U1F43_26220 [Myxococcota bacterium]